MYWKRSNPNCNGNTRANVALRTTCIKNVKFKIIKIKAGCQYVGYFYYSKNLTGPHITFVQPEGRGLNIPGLDVKIKMYILKHNIF